MSRARLGVRCRYRDDIRLDSRYAKTSRQWCHVLVSAFVGAPRRRAPPPPRPVSEGREGGRGGGGRRGTPRRARDTIPTLS